MISDTGSTTLAFIHVIDWADQIRVLFGMGYWPQTRVHQGWSKQLGCGGDGRAVAEYKWSGLCILTGIIMMSIYTSEINNERVSCINRWSACKEHVA